MSPAEAETIETVRRARCFGLAAGQRCCCCRAEEETMRRAGDSVADGDETIGLDDDIEGLLALSVARCMVLGSSHYKKEVNSRWIACGDSKSRAALHALSPSQR